MRNRANARLVGWTILAGVVAFSFSAWPCSIPVFRWALERWEPDNYRLAVFYRGAIEPAQGEILEAIEARAADAEHPVNLQVIRIDLDGEMDDASAALWKEHADATLPWAVLHYPAGTHIAAAVWAGNLGDVNVEALVDSPARQQIVKDLVAGVSAVWVLVESGDPSKDLAAATRLNQQLEQAKNALKLPDITDDPVLDGPNAPDVSDLRVDFSMHRIKRDDPAERFLTAMLTKSESDLESLAAEPMAFPVFGRGRALYAFVGKGINSDTIGRACAFLIGGCSCELKAENPGTDLLLACDWEGKLGSMELIHEIELPPLPGVATPSIEETPGQEAPSEPLGDSASEPDGRNGVSTLARHAILAVVAVGALVLIATAVIFKRTALK
ncbi:MAG TPA: hypothetical protein PLO37_02735 [Candidatus Hydrogenedentes bacterium]|nr:hypothetical protein [Candidatus Hydrogenedentota bacterium]HPG65736.1 hypothetical protein [Candidatus Hydrogenedentota bacterium]